MLIRLENITKYYSSASNVTMALQKINLEFDKTGFVAITGESGSGKSTLISVISGMLPYEEGELYFDEHPMSAYDDSDWDEFRKNRIGFVFQEYNLIDSYTVLDNVESAIIIRGIRDKNIREYAKEIIRRVGLEDFARQKASRLSSGQKQRLAIARALAKDADIIVADEPTGNLDSENGQKIMELFASIAKEKLVIMVTHNYEQAKPYVNRQIRMFDGKVVSDTEVRGVEAKADTESEAAGNSQGNAEKCAEEHKNRKKNNTRVAWKYTRKNLTRQPVQSFLIAFFVIITSVIAFVFMGMIISNYDDTYTKKYDSNVFAYESDRRIVVKKEDGSAINADDMELFASIDYVVAVEEYDLCNDINYRNIVGEDYYLSYYDVLIDEETNEVEQRREILFNQKSELKYMCSASCITEADLSEGRLPENRNEIVMYVEGSLADVGTETIFFENDTLWNDKFYEYDFEVVGILKEKTSQIYFSESFCDMLTAPYKQGEVKLYDAWCLISKHYKYIDYLYPRIDESMEGMAVRFSRAYNPPYEPDKGEAHALCDTFGKYGGTVNMSVSKITNSGDIEEYEFKEVLIEDIQRTDPTEAAFINVSEEFFYTLYDYGSQQASLYIEHYAYTDEVLDELEENGYQAISTYRASSLEYDTDKMNNRVALLLISFAVLIILAVLEVFIVSTFLRLRKKFYSVFNFMGMEAGTIKKINYMEINLYAAIAVMLTLLAAWLIDYMELLTWVNEITVYMQPMHYFIFIIYNFLLAEITAWIFNRYLDKKLYNKK